MRRKRRVSDDELTGADRFLGAVVLHEMVNRGAPRSELIEEALRQRRFDVVRHLQSGLSRVSQVKDSST